MSAAINKFDFDQFPDNAVTSIDEGLALKISVNDLGAATGQTSLDGSSVHICAFYPRFLGACSGLPIQICKVKIAKNLIWQFNFAHNPIPFDVDDSLVIKEFGVGLYTKSDFRFDIQLFKDATGGALSKISLFGFAPLNSNGIKTLIFYHGSLDTYNNPTKNIYPCIFYTHTIPNDAVSYNLGVPPQGIPFMVGKVQPMLCFTACVSQPSDLTSRMKQLFPDSWLI